MIKTIWKYPLSIRDDQILEIPENAKILTAQVQNGVACMWALVNPETPRVEKRYIRIIETGHEIHDSEKLVYISTIQLQNLNLVFHVFEEVKNSTILLIKKE